MADKKFKLSSGKDVVLLEMSVDDIDFCNDVTQVVFDNEGNQRTYGETQGVSREAPPVPSHPHQ